MSVYLHDIPLTEAQAVLRQALEAIGKWTRLGVEEIPLDEMAVGRVLAEPVWAKISSPNYHAAAMDGFAVRASQTVGAAPGTPGYLSYFERPAASAEKDTLRSPEKAVARTAYIDTGDMLPEWADAVIPIENVEPLDERGEISANPRRPRTIRIRAAVAPWSNVRPYGEDIVASQLVLPAGHILRPVDLGAIAASGHTRVHAARKPRVAIIPTGSELRQVGDPVQPGEIIEFNSIVLAGQVNSWGGQAQRFGIVTDHFEEIKRCVLSAAATHDLILLNAGSSAGSEDFSAEVVQAAGRLLVHGVAVRPGHPVIIGIVQPQQGAEGVPVIGIPGYPVSAALTGEIFVEPLLARWLGRPPAEPIVLPAILTRKITSPAGDDEYLRVVVGRVGERLLAAPLARGAGVITSLVRADGIAIIPSGSQGMPAGAEVNVRLYRPPAELERTILAIGSHDMTLDLLGQYLAERERRFVSSNVGSLGGLAALRRGEAHLAGSHLLDSLTGEYNLAYVREYLPGMHVVLVNLVGRQQGLLVRRGNPRNIQSLADLADPEIVMVNRQRGAGTRVLLDYHLGKMGLQPAQLNGYEREEFTHLTLAAAVASGKADTGLGIAAAAQALDLDFIPLFQEPYELIIPGRYYQDELLAPLLDVLKDPAFRRAVRSMPGYDVSRMGEVVAEFAPNLS